MTERLILRYQNNTGNFRKVRIWEKVGQNTVREIDTELGYNYPKEQWETVHEHIRNYEITNDGLLVGDGSGWNGTNRLWTEWAKERHTELLKVRFPNDFGENDRDPTLRETVTELVEQQI